MLQMAGMDMSRPRHGAAAKSASYPVPKTLDLARLKPFVDALPVPEVLRPTAHAHYSVRMREAQHQIHRDVPAGRWWTYNGSVPGPTIVAHRGEPITVEWVNELPEKHFLPIDPNICGAEPGTPETRAVVHLHGGIVPEASDGYPERWYVPRKSATYSYPMRQEAATLWYHDHAMGIERLNVYAGLFGSFLVRDEVEAALHLPQGEFEIPLMISDRLFTADGQLYYPNSGVP